MTDYNFLDNAKQGKNNWWRYPLTLFITIIIGMVISIIGFAVGEVFISSLNIHLPSDTITEEILCPGGLFLFGIILSFFFLCVRFIHKRKIITLITAHKNVLWKRIFKGMILYGCILSLVTFLDFLWDPSSYKVTFDLNQFGWLLIASLLTIPFAAFVEEVFFRGYLMQAFSLLTKRPIIPILITSIIFGLLHYDNGLNPTLSIITVISCGLFGFVMALIVVGEGGLETAIGIHIINNLFISIICYDTLNGILDLPTLITVYTDPHLNLIEYIPSLIMEIMEYILVLIVLFWGKFDALKDIFSLKKIS